VIASRLRIVVTDANVLINLIHVGRLDVLSALEGYEFVVPADVREEITDLDQRAALEEAIGRSFFRIEHVTELETVALVAELRARLGTGESACLALAHRRGWTVASDEKGRFRREAEKRIGPERILGTADIFLMAIQGGRMTIAEADADKVALEGHRFRMPFTSFRELVRAADRS
jgi:predicted nucleic acid-binding protein